MKRIIHSNGLQSKNAKKRKLLKFREWCKRKYSDPTQPKQKRLKKISEWGGKIWTDKPWN